MDVPRPGTESKLQLPLHSHAGFFNPLHRDRDRTHTSAATRATAVWCLTHCATAGTPFGYSFFFFFFGFLGLHTRHMEVPRWGVELDLQLPASTTATATWDPSLLCDLHHSLQQHWILNSLSKTRDRTCVLMDTSRIRYCWARTGTPSCSF